ncbi:MAG: RNA polymerase sigma factor [Bryobacteraceae bacterium]
MLSSYPLDEDIAGVAQPKGTSAALRDQVARLFEEARDDVYRYLLTLGLHPPQAQEATQEVFLRMYATLRKGEEIRTPRAWIFRVAHNLGLKIRARQHYETAFCPDLEACLAVPGPTPERALLDRERTRRFHRAVEGLSEQQRRCLFLRMEGLRYPEIGAALGISASSVGEFLRRAIARLRKASHE